MASLTLYRMRLPSPIAHVSLSPLTQNPSSVKHSHFPPPASNLLRFSCVATSLHDGRALATYKSSHSSMPCSPTSPKAAISTSSASTRSDAKHILLLTSSLIPRRFWNSIFSMHSCRPSAYSRLVRSRAVRLAAARRCIGFRISPRASARMKLARKAARSWI